MKVLVIANNPFSKINNNGKTLEAIFSSFDRTELCQLFIRPIGNDIDWGFCSSYYMITDEDILKKIKHPSISIGRELLPNQICFDESSNAKTPAKTFSWKRLAREYLWKIGFWKNNNLTNWLQKEAPELIFFVGGNSGFVYDIANHISEFLKINIITFFTDDYIIYPLQNSVISKWHLSILLKKYRQIISKSVKVFCIGEKMAKEYSDYFGTSFNVIMNLIDIGSFAPKNVNKPIKKISYFGGLHLHRWKTIGHIASILPADVNIHVYTFQPIIGEIKELFDYVGVKYHEGLTGNVLQEEINGSDALLHVESDDLEYKAITMLSVSTKIPEYLISCRPILAIGPSEVASMSLLSQNDIGFVIESKKSNNEIQRLINVFLNNGELRHRLVSKGYDYVRLNFDKNIKSKDFKKELANHVLLPK